MKTMTIRIASADIYPEVYKQSEYLAAKKTNADEVVYQNLRANKYSSQMLDTFFGQAAETADLQLMDFSRRPSSGEEEGVYLREYKQPARYDASMWDFATNALKSFFVHFIIAKWLEICNADSSLYSELAASDIADVRQKLYDKEAPAYKGIPAVSDKYIKGEAGTDAPQKSKTTNYQKGK